MKAAEKRTNVSETILAEMRQTNELFNSEVIGNQKMDTLDRI
jgi:hypothetical protein